MAWYIIREATHDDHAVLDARAQAFIERHNLNFRPPDRESGESWHGLVEGYLLDGDERDFDLHNTKRLRRLWRRIVARALGHEWAEGIAHGYVGYWRD